MRTPAKAKTGTGKTTSDWIGELHHHSNQTKDTCIRHKYDESRSIRQSLEAWSERRFFVSGSDLSSRLQFLRFGLNFSAKKLIPPAEKLDTN